MRILDRAVLPHPAIAGAAIAGYMLTYMLEWLFSLFATDITEGANGTRMGILILAALGHGAMRIWATHPAYHGEYRVTLARFPWDMSKPWPAGSPCLTITDAIVLGILAALWRSNQGVVFVWPVMAFLLTYLSGFLLTMDAGGLKIIALIAGIGPFAFYPHKNAFAASVVLGAVYLIVYARFRVKFGEFPWNDGYWKGSAVDGMKRSSFITRVVGWPYHVMNRASRFRGMTLSECLLIAVLITWWGHAVTGVLTSSDGSALWGLLFHIVGWLIYGRILIYIAPGRLPPLSIAGRICTLRLIIPGYDKVFIAPLVAAASAAAVSVAGRKMGISPVLTFDCSVFLATLCVLALPPTLREWRHTGHFRLRRNMFAEKQAAPSPRAIKIAEFLADKLP